MFDLSEANFHYSGVEPLQGTVLSKQPLTGKRADRPKFPWNRGVVSIRCIFALSENTSSNFDFERKNFESRCGPPFGLRF